MTTAIALARSGLRLVGRGPVQNIQPRRIFSDIRHVSGPRKLDRVERLIDKSRLLQCYLRETQAATNDYDRSDTPDSRQPRS